MNDTNIRIGIIGAGTNTRAMHIPKLQAIKGVEIVSVCNRSRESGAKVAREFKIPEVCERWDEVVADDTLDAVVIGTWPNRHCLLSCAALEHGKHVLCEARMAMNAAEAHQMLETAESYPELVAQIVPSPFTLKFDRTIQDLIADGFLGDLYAIEVRGISTAFINKSSTLQWRQDFSLSGYNTLAMGIWYEALMRWVGEASRVMAMSKVFVKQRKDEATGRLAAVRVPEHVDIIADMVCGAQAHLQFSAVTGLATATSGAWLFGSEGTLHLDTSAEKLYGGRRGAGSLAEIPITPEKAGGWRVEEEFINAIRGQEEIKLTSFADGVKYMEFTEAVARSAATGKAVNLPLL
ncbi:MAG TPA: Gfo/Idh/MocA family oxidoreductase [Abditibacteriaceae bacterium]|nr:Gfo/Idh/MocA family oxidoreductase [Abditibacteriaceae bacterium]